MFNRRKEGECRKIAECIAEPPTLTVARSPVGGGPARRPGSLWVRWAVGPVRWWRFCLSHLQ